MAVRKLMALLVLLGTTALLAPGCATVRPWQRQHLATDVMSRTARPEEATCERTFFESREGATGGHAVGAGGGCACN